MPNSKLPSAASTSFYAIATKASIDFFSQQPLSYILITSRPLFSALLDFWIIILLWPRTFNLWPINYNLHPPPPTSNLQPPTSNLQPTLFLNMSGSSSYHRNSRKYFSLSFLCVMARMIISRWADSLNMTSKFSSFTAFLQSPGDFISRHPTVCGRQSRGSQK